MMGKIKIKLLISLITISTYCAGQHAIDYLEVIETKGTDPINFVQQKLETFDLLLFDDGLHSAYEPFQFYTQLLRDPNTAIDYVFIEVLGINVQADIDSFLASETKDERLLLKVFQDDFSGFGWRYETYLDLLTTVWDINHDQTDQEKKIQVIGVDQPVYWEGIHDRKDYDVFLNSLTARDYFMYRIIVDKMDHFKSDKKGIFLSNTRHIYKNIRNKEGSLYWNCGTFFYHWHPKKTYSIRIHNVMLSFESANKDKKGKTAEGLDNVSYRWIKMENGLWDKAFELNENRPVAIPLEGNPFGKANYVGNHMLRSEDSLTMYDAIDALIFLAPLDQLHFSAKMNFFYTDEFRRELKRRIGIIYGEDLDSFLNDNEVTTLDEYLDTLTTYTPRAKNELLIE